MIIKEINVPPAPTVEPHDFFAYLVPIIVYIADYNCGVTIVIQDESRYRPRIYTDCIISRFLEHFTCDDVTIVVANGMHRACSEDELERLIGQGSCGKFRIYQHNPMCSLPTQIFNTPCVAIHNSMPHMHTGFAMAGKMFCPGLALYNDAVDFHLGGQKKAFNQMLKLN